MVRRKGLRSRPWRFRGPALKWLVVSLPASMLASNAGVESVLTVGRDAISEAGIPMAVRGSKILSAPPGRAFRSPRDLTIPKCPRCISPFIPEQCRPALFFGPLQPTLAIEVDA